MTINLITIVSFSKTCNGTLCTSGHILSDLVVYTPGHILSDLTVYTSGNTFGDLAVLVREQIHSVIKLTKGTKTATGSMPFSTDAPTWPHS